MTSRSSALGRLARSGFIAAGLILALMAPATAQYRPPYAEMVVDGRTGRVLYAVNADSLRHPASLTKVMTLYMLFEQLESGKITLDTEFKVSARAQRQSPSKLGLAAGETIRVEDAIKALITKSANDVAVVVAENLAGSEDEFARLMTRKAQSIGMKRTVYANASGLPNAKQLTTARDQITLGQAIKKRFPTYFDYFSLRNFEYEGTAISTHNKLLGRVRGVDGIKTGYTQRSGFNLLTSVHTDDRSLVAVILGGRSGRTRDTRMADLIETYLPAAATTVASAKVAKLPQSKTPQPPVQDENVPDTESEDVAEAGSSESPAVAAVEQPAAAKPATPAIASASTKAEPESVEMAAAPAPAPRVMPLPVQAPDPDPAPPSQVTAYAEPETAKTVQPDDKIAVTASGVKLAWQTGALPAEPKMTGSRRPSNANSFFVQVGIARTQSDAKRLLSSARDKVGGPLSSASMQTERVTVNGKTVWRARFGIDDEALAHNACRTLKRSNMACFVSRG